MEFIDYKIKEISKVTAGGDKPKVCSDVYSDETPIPIYSNGMENEGWKYGMAKHMRDALPNATFIGFTGTPIDMKDKSTIEVFGNYIDIYDMTQAVDDGATVPIYYENRTAKLKLNEEVLKKIDAEYAAIAGDSTELEIEKSKADLTSIEAVVGSAERLNMLADDIIAHYEDRQYVLTGKAMIVCMTRRIAINLYKLLIQKRPDWEKKVKVVLTDNNKDPEDWHDIIGNKAYRDGLMVEFKNIESDFKIAIVVDMWLTGFDVPSMATMYIDKPMKGHTLMQAIARVNRVYKDKEAGLIVDYIGICAQCVKNGLCDIPAGTIGTIQTDLDPLERIDAQRNQIAHIAVATCHIVHSAADMLTMSKGQLRPVLVEHMEFSIDVVLYQQQSFLRHFLAVAVD